MSTAVHKLMSDVGFAVPPACLTRYTDAFEQVCQDPTVLGDSEFKRCIRAQMFFMAYKEPAFLLYLSQNVEDMRAMVQEMSHHMGGKRVTDYADYLELMWLNQGLGKPTEMMVLPPHRKFLVQSSTVKIEAGSRLIEILKCLCRLMLARADDKYHKKKMLFVEAVGWDSHVMKAVRDGDTVMSELLAEQIGHSNKLGYHLTKLQTKYGEAIGNTFGYHYETKEGMPQQAVAFHRLIGEADTWLRPTITDLLSK